MKYLFLLLLIVPCLIFAGTVDKDQLVNAPAYQSDADLTDYSKFDHALPPYQPPLMDDPAQFGTTWYDFMNYGSQTKMVVYDYDEYTHFTWMNGLNYGSSYRHVFYNFHDPNSGFPFPGGVIAIASQRSGYPTMDVLADGRGIIACHAILNGYNGYPTVVAKDYFPHVGAFMTFIIPSGNDTIIWPHIAVDIDDNGYVFGREMPDTDYDLIYHSYSSDECETFSAYEFADTANVPSFTVATSRISGRAAYGYHQFLEDYQNHPQWAGYLAMQINNDAMAVIKEEGEDWDFTNFINITNIIKGDASLLPDTILAQGDTLRAYLDIDLMFDNDDVLHAMFTSRGLYEAPWMTTAPPISGLTEASIIWHWREDTDSLNVVANGWWNSASSVVTGGRGAWKSTICRPSMGIDEDGNIYCAFEGYHDYLTNPDTSAAGWANGDIFVTVSTDGGYNWALPLNVTDTHSNGANPGDCFSECFSSLAEEIDDSLRIFYMEDKDAGSYIFNEGMITLNPMMYAAVAAVDIPTTPLVEQFYFHLTGVTTVPEAAVTLTPYNTQIPPAGGSLDFNIALDNNTGSPLTVDVWTEIVLPEIGSAGPLINVENLLLPPNISLDRDRNQAVPSFAPPGEYTYYAYLGDYPWVIDTFDSFTFIKTGDDGGCSLGDVSDWPCSGESLADAASCEQLPASITLADPFPNPFNSETILSFFLPAGERVILSVYNIEGKESAALIDEYLPGGNHQASLRGERLSSGVYFARLTAGGSVQTVKLLHLK